MSEQGYTPRPLDTSKIHLTDEILRLAELFAENAHDVWAQERMAEGWKHGPLRDDAKKEHPCLVPYKKLPESEKRYDRTAALQTVRTLISLGYRKEQTPTDQLIQGGDLEERAKAVLARIKQPALTLSELRRMWEERLPIVWYRDVQIYRRGVDTALRMGESFLAFDMSVEGLLAFKDDLRLIQLQALALARTGATKRANALLEYLRRSGHQDEETLGLLARTHKDFWQISGDPHERQRHLKLSFDLYLDSYKRNRGYYSGINAATTGLIYGEKEIAQTLAREVLDICESTLEVIGPESGERYWLEATLAEAALILGDLKKAEAYYLRGCEQGTMNAVVVSRTRTQARLILEHVCGETNKLDHCFVLPRIAVFSGHMFDRPGRKEPRFPHTMEDAVREEVRARLESLNAQVGFSSLACGGDLIFAESLLERGGEVNIVLPFRKEDFKESSVEIMPGSNWGARFEHVMENAATVIVLNEVGDPHDAAAYEFCNQALSGLALLKSQVLGMDVAPLAVWDGRPGDGAGGTQSFIDYWRKKRESTVEIIPVEVGGKTVARSKPLDYQTERLHRSDLIKAPPMEIKAMIFADVVGFTKLNETQIPLFVDKFLGSIADCLARQPNQPAYKNTWGDAVCCAFDHVRDAGVFGLDLRDLVIQTDWSQFGLPRELSIRIALHAGPVFPCTDPILGKRTYNGSHVNRTARIEPIAEEGQVYASEAFSALATAEGVKEFNCDYVGTKQLAKKYGAIPVFLVRRNF
jgi:class 3 adenylate cyclase